MKRPALYALIPFCLGIALSGICVIPIILTILSAIFFSVLSGFFSKNRALAHTALFLAILFAGMAVHLNSRIISSDHVSRSIESGGNNFVVLKGRVIDDPVAAPTIYHTVKTSFLLKAQMLKEDASWQNVSGLVRADIFSNSMAGVSFGDEIILDGVISKPQGLNNPGLFDYAEYLENKDIYCRIRVKNKDGFKVLNRDGDKPGSNPAYHLLDRIKTISFGIRHRMSSLIDEYLTMPYSGFLKAILVGDRTDLKDSIQDPFIQTGTVHVIAVSGLQVGLIAAVFLAVFGVLRIPKRVNLVITTILLVFYAFVAGSNPPIIRSVVMFAVYVLGYFINRETDAINSLAIAAIAILLWNPKELYDPSFQLSFVSIASTLLFTTKLNSFFPVIQGKRKKRNWFAIIYVYITTGVSVSIAAWIGSFPIVASYFNIISPVSVVANLIVIPILFFLTAGFFLFFAASLLSASIAFWFGSILQFTEKLLFAINGYLSGIPFAFFRIGKPSLLFMVAYYALAAIFIMPPIIEIGRMKITKRRITIIVLILFNLTIWPSALDVGRKNLEATFLDVGQGDCAFVEFPGGGNMLIDGGSGGEEDRFDVGKSVIAPFLWNKGIETIDLVVVTHFHEDHMGGLLYVLENFNVGCVVDNGAAPAAESRKKYSEYTRLVERKGIRRLVVSEGDALRAFADTSIFILNPVGEKELSDSNDNSIVLKIEYKNIAFLFCGDIKDRAMSRLLPVGNFLRSDIVKIPHHGGNPGNRKAAESFYSLVSPEISVVSVGSTGKYRMPSGDVINMLTYLKSKCYVTKYTGAIEIDVNPKSNKKLIKTLNKN